MWFFFRSGPLPPHRQRGPHHEEVHPVVAGKDRQGRKGVRTGEISKGFLIIIFIYCFVCQTGVRVRIHLLHHLRGLRQVPGQFEDIFLVSC